LKAFLWGLVIGLITIPLAVLAYFASGRAPVGTAGGALPFERALASGALHARIEREMPKTVPIPADEATYLAAVPVYQHQCAMCHGVPGSDMTSIAKGMFPKPPQLFRGKGVTDDRPGETYWKVSNGIRLTGMPGFKRSLSDTDMWEVSLLLANADKLSDSVRQALAAPPAPPMAAVPAAGATAPPPPGQAASPAVPAVPTK
jgi:thiosulfate dehydrogenase